MLGALFQDVQQRFPGYLFELRQILMLHNLTIGSEDTLPSIAADLTSASELRVSLARVLRAMIRREHEQISSVELLALLMQAGGHPPAQNEDARVEAAIEEILGFILEVRHPRDNSDASSKPALLRPGISAEGFRASYGAAPPIAEPQFRRSTPAFESGAAESSISNRWTMVIVTACLITVGFAVKVAFYQRGVALPSAMNKTSGANVMTSNSEQSRQATDTRNVFRHRGLLSLGRSTSNTQATAFHVASNSNNLHAPSASPLSRQSDGASRVNTPDVVPATHPAPREASDLREADTPAPIERAGAASTNPARVRTNTSPLDSDRNSDLRTQLGGYVHSASAGIMAGNVISSPAPAYPSAASAAGVQGEVTIRAVVGRDGNVTDARVVSGPPLLRDAALQAVQQWQYRPYLVDGKPSLIATTAIIDFKLPTS